VENFVKSDKDKIVLFSGRFDPPHIGHLCTIIKLAQKYGVVKVPILDHPERRFPVIYCKKMIEDVLNKTKLDVKFSVNNIHFGRITKEEIDKYKPFDLYISGNLAVLRHVETIGIPCEYVDTAYQFKASSYPAPE